MLSFFGLVIFLLMHSILKKRQRHIAVFSIWLFLVLWFFNSPLFGFSAVSVSSEGIKLHYGLLSFRNDLLPLESKWKIKTYMSGIRRNRRLHFISIGDRQSMKVRGAKDVQLLERIGASIEHVKKSVGLVSHRLNCHPMGSCYSAQGSNTTPVKNFSSMLSTFFRQPLLKCFVAHQRKARPPSPGGPSRRIA